MEVVESHDLAFQHVHVLVMKALHHIVVWQQHVILVLTNEHFDIRTHMVLSQKWSGKAYACFQKTF
jgi:hypothetical protein